MRRLLCVFGHRWETTHYDLMRMVALLHLSILAGQRSECTRCGAVFDDLSPAAREYFKL